MKRRESLFTIIAIILVVAAAWGTRWKALTTLNIDYDEDDYLRAAQEFTQVYRSGNLKEIQNTNYRPEHPPLAKMILGLSLLSQPEKPLAPDRPTTAGPNQYLPRDLLRAGRITNAVFGMVTVGLLAALNPLAGLFLAGHAWTIKYVSQIMLEAVPALTSLLCVVAYLQWKKKKEIRFAGWLIPSSIFLGLTAASKYLYCVVALAVLVDWIMDAEDRGGWKKNARIALLWSFLAIVVFLIFNPYLWPDPIGRLRESIFYHAAYSQGASEVERANYPFWQQLNWLSTSPRVWQADAFYFSVDPLIALLAALGIPQAWKKQRVFSLWLIIAFLFLLVWPTKWPQYLITLSVPLSASAAEGFRSMVADPIQAWLIRRRAGGTRLRDRAKSEIRQAAPWLIPGLIAFAGFTLLPLLYQLIVSLTDFNSASIRDGLTGGIWREFWGGLTGSIAAALQEFPYRSKTVHYIGLENFAPVLSYLTQTGTLVLNFLWTVLSVSLQVGLGVLAALLLWQRGVRFSRGWQALFVLPWAIPELIGALMWLNVFAPGTGWLSLAARDYGQDIPFSFLLGWENSPSMWLLVLLIAGVWYGFPFMMLAASAGLKMMPVEVYDAVQLDGASELQTFRFVTWPLLAPLIIPAIIVRGIFAFNQFYLFQAFNIFNGTLATLSYNFFNPSGYFINGQFAISAVINVLTVIILMGFIIFLNRWSKAGEGVTYA